MSQQKGNSAQQSVSEKARPSDEKEAREKQLSLSPERSEKKEDDDITPHYVRGYN